MMGLPLPLIGLSLLFSIAMCVHAVRTHQEMFWLWVILFFQPIGGIVYVVAILIPSLTGGTIARKVGAAARETLDPTREYRTAKAAVDDTPTVHNRMRLAEAAGELGRWDEALVQYREAAQGVHAEDPALSLSPGRYELMLGGQAYDLTVAGEVTDPAHCVEGVTTVRGQVFNECKPVL